MSNNFVTLILKTLFRRAQYDTLTKVNSLIFSISQALFLNILAYTPDFMDRHYKVLVHTVKRPG